MLFDLRDALDDPLVTHPTIAFFIPLARTWCLQAAGGHGPERKERIDWMYEGPMQSAQDKQAEANEYLLGKEVSARAVNMDHTSWVTKFNAFPLHCGLLTRA